MNTPKQFAPPEASSADVNIPEEAGKAGPSRTPPPAHSRRRIIHPPTRYSPPLETVRQPRARSIDRSRKPPSTTPTTSKILPPAAVPIKTATVDVPPTQDKVIMTKAIAAPAPPQRVPSVATVEANDDPTQLVVLLNELTGELMEITASETIELQDIVQAADQYVRGQTTSSR